LKVIAKSWKDKLTWVVQTFKFKFLLVAFHKLPTNKSKKFLERLGQGKTCHWTKSIMWNWNLLKECQFLNYIFEDQIWIWNAETGVAWTLSKRGTISKSPFDDFHIFHRILWNLISRSTIYSIDIKIFLHEIMNWDRGMLNL